jgi:hypothetical protein
MSAASAPDACRTRSKPTDWPSRFRALRLTVPWFQGSSPSTRPGSRPHPSTRPLRHSSPRCPPEQRAQTVFAVDDPEWRKWMNQHFYLRQSTSFKEMTEAQREDGLPGFNRWVQSRESSALPGEGKSGETGMPVRRGRAATAISQRPGADCQKHPPRSLPAAVECWRRCHTLQMTPRDGRAGESVASSHESRACPGQERTKEGFDICTSRSSRIILR